MRIDKYMFLVLLLLTSSCFNVNKVLSDSKPISHNIWNSILKNYVDDKGGVNYQEIQKDSLRLNQYLKIVSSNHPNDKNWSKNEQLAYWINAYNAFTVRLIIRSYPAESIRDIAGSIPFINSAWDYEFITIENQSYDLNDIEHGIIRTYYSEPRIHFALVCAAISCPKLRNEAYQAEGLQDQLQEQAVDFINDKSKNTINNEFAEVSKIFMWYNSDFTEDMELWEYLNKYSIIKLKANSEIDYADYEWLLNEQ
jgi:hypothetical protein